MRHWKPKQFDLAEVQAVQNDEGGHDSLEGRLKDSKVKKSSSQECSDLTG